MSDERIMIIKEQLVNLERRIRPLEWDFSRNQINEYRKLQLGQLKIEYENFIQELASLQKIDES